MTDEAKTLPAADGAPVQRGVGRPAPERDTDCEDQGFGSIAEGCNRWPCNRTPLAKWSLGWRCPTCGGCY